MHACTLERKLGLENLKTEPSLEASDFYAFVELNLLGNVRL